MIPGPPPKPDEERQRRNAQPYDIQYIQWDGKTRGPELPKDIGVSWCPKTQQWWDIWRNSPNAMLMTDADWEVMLETALLHNEFWSPKIVLDHKARKGDAKFKQVSKSPAELTTLAKEIRARLAAYGATYEDRRKLRLEFVTDASSSAYEARVEQEAKEVVDYATLLAQKAAEQKG